MAQYPSAAAGDSNLYIAVNKTSTTLTNNPLAAGAVTVNVLDASAFPSVGAISIDAEIIHYTGKTPTSVTGCTRGFDGTIDVAHTVGTPVYHKVIADHHNVLKEELKAIEADLVSVQAALNDVDTPASTATDVKDRLDQIVSQLKLISGGANWYTTPVKKLTQLLPLSGGTMTGGIAMSGTQKLTGLAAGTVNGDSVRYEQLFGQFLPLSGGTLTGGLKIPDGTGSAPTLAFANDTGTGIYLGSSGGAYLGLSVGGVLQFYVQNGLVMNTGVIRNNAGTAASPSYTFWGDSDTGIYAAAANTLAFSTGGTIRALLTSSEFSIQTDGCQIEARSGSASAPGFAFQANTDCGFYLGGNDINITNNNSRTISFQTGMIECDRTVQPSSDNAVSMGISGKRWTAVWAVNGTIQTSMSDTKENIVELTPEECTVPVPAKFNRPGEDPTKPRLGWIADSLPAEAHPVGEDGNRVADSIYTDAVLAQLCLAARNDYERLAALDVKIAALETENLALKDRLAILEAPQG